MNETGTDRDAERAFENFLQGKDRLSALLRATPGFEPPATMTDAFVYWVKEAQATRGQSLANAGEQALGFEPPPQLEQTFLREAAAIQAAQAPRREAVLQQLADGQTAKAVLGADVTAGTRAWLDRQQAARASSATATKTAEPKRELTPWRVQMQRFAVVFSVALIAGIATNMLLRSGGQPKVETAAVDEPTAPAEKTNASRVSSAAPSAAKPAAAPTRARAAGELAARAAPVDLSQRHDAPELARLSQPATPAAADVLAKRESDVVARDGAQRNISERNISERDSATKDGAPKKVAQEMPLAQADVAAAPASVSAGAPAAPPPAVVAARVTPEPLGTLDKAREAALPMTIFNASLNDDARKVAERLLSNNATSNNIANTQGQQLWIMTASPENAQVKEWAERLRLALPPGIRPVEIQLQADTQLAPDSLRIELR